MEIQTRDLKLLHALDRYGILSSKQIETSFFKNTHFTVMNRRLKILEKENLILRTDSLPTKMLAWSLSKKGAATINRAPPQRYSNRNTTLHDVTASGVRMAFEAMGFGSDFTSEMELKRLDGIQNGRDKSSSTQIPDGLFIEKLKPDCLDMVVTLEVEVNPKSHARYRKILKHYLTQFNVGVVWYLVSKKGIIKPILNQWRKSERYKGSPDIFFTEIDELSSKGKNAEVLIASSKENRIYSVTINDRFITKSETMETAKKVMPQTAEPLGRKTENEVGRDVA